MKQKWIKKGDKVLVISGNDSGKVGEVIAKDDTRILVQGINVRKRHMKARQQGQKSDIISLEKPIHISNVALVCKNCKEHTRIGMKVLDDGRRERTCKKCGNAIE